MVSYRDLLKKSSMLSLGVGSSYFTYYYLKNHRKELLDICEDVKLNSLDLYRKFIGDHPEKNYSQSYRHENDDEPAKVNSRLLSKASSLYQVPLTETSEIALSDHNAILSAVNEDLREFKARITSAFQEHELIGLRKLDELSHSIDSLRDRILEAEQLLGQADLDRDKKLVLMCFHEKPLKNCITGISSYLKSVIQTFGTDLSIPTNIASIIFPFQSFPLILYGPTSSTDDISALLENGMVSDAHDKLNQLEGIQRAIVKPAILELQRLIEVQFLEECQKALVL